MYSTIRGAMARLRTEARDFTELVAAPCLVALLPWPLGLRLMRLLARRTPLYDTNCKAALAQAQARGVVGDAASWLAQRRLTTLLDHADYYLEQSRSDAWMRRHVQVQGDWPDPDQPGILCTFHWGAGMWALRHAAAHGLKVHALAAAPTQAHFPGRRVAFAYGRRRLASVARILGRPTVDVSASLRPALQTLRAGGQLLAVVDVPADQVASSHPIELLGMQARTPKALFRLAVQQQIPVTVFLAGLDPATGARSLRIHALGTYSELDPLIRDVYAELERAMQENSAAWHFWGEAERFFRA